MRDPGVADLAEGPSIVLEQMQIIAQSARGLEDTGFAV